MTDELTARGIDLSSYQSRFAKEVAAAKAAGVLGGIPSSALVTEEPEKNHQWFGLAGLVMFGLVVIHKWLLGDATTWRKEQTLALCLFSALMFTWDPTVRLIRGQASGELVFWLVLGWIYFAAIAATLAVPSLGRVVASLNPLLIATAIASPAIVIGVRRAVRRFRPASEPAKSDHEL